jgi:hypothetical protein
MMGVDRATISKTPYTVYEGTAAEDIEENSVVLKVICPELSPHSPYGSVGAGITQGSVTLSDRDGNKISTPLTAANHVVATWEGASNQKYPPLIRKGEPVEVFKLADQNKFQWRTTGRGRGFRTTDRMYFDIAATDPSKPGVDKDDTNTYSLYMDSQNKKLGGKTSKANGEVAAFSFEFDLAAGTFHITDDSEEPGNRIFLDVGAKTGKPVFQVNLSTGLAMKFEKDDAYFKIPKKLIIDVGDRFILNSPLTIFNLSKKGAVIINASSVAINTARDFIVSASNAIGLSAAATKVGGILVAAGLRTPNAVKGAAGSDYKPVSVNRPEESPVSEANNQADTNMVGLPYRN